MTPAKDYNIKDIPLGIDNFVTLISENYYFFDKSEYIRTVETQRNFILFVRPRRMGKTLFSSMLMTYYDINYKSRFQELFGNLNIAKNPTPLANSFLCLKFDFSHVACDFDELKLQFTNYCFKQLKLFFSNYGQFFTEKEINEVLSSSTIKEAVVYLVEIIHLKGLKIYLFIDEYDNFTNMVLSARGVKAHEEITHGEGFYRDFFKGFKGTFDRIFMTGVSPATYDDLTSGFSIADVVALNPRFNEAIGITEQELCEMIDYYRQQGIIKRFTDELVDEMKPWYDHFCFSLRSFEKEHTIFNTSMVLRYINSLILTGFPPEEMVDRSARTEPKTLNFLVNSEELRNRDERVEIIKEICATGFTTGEVESEFPAADAGDEKNFKSMLFYYGTLTFGGRDDLGFPKLIIPNKSMGDLYLNYMLQVAQQEGFYLNGRRKVLDSVIKLAAVDGQWKPMATELGKLVYEYSSLRNSNKGEASIQAFVRGLLCTSPFFDVWPEVELNNGFSDVLLVPRNSENCPTRHSYVIELKYMKSREKDKDKYIKEACTQLSQYADDIHLKESCVLRGTSLTLLYLVFRNHKLIDIGEFFPEGGGGRRG